MTNDEPIIPELEQGSWWLSHVYDNATVAEKTKEEALKMAWREEEENIEKVYLAKDVKKLLDQKDDVIRMINVYLKSGPMTAADFKVLTAGRWTDDEAIKETISKSIPERP